MAEISKITLPSGNTYDIKDATARQMISGGVSFIVAWDGTGTPTASNIPKGVVAGGVTGTLEAANAQAGAFYLVKSASTPSSETLDIYDEYVVVGSTTKSWEKIGDTQLNLSDVVTGVSLTKQTDVVLGEATTFTGVNPTITVTPSTTYLGATASGTAVGANGTAAAITGFGTHTTDTFVKSVTAETNKNLVTTTITGTNGTESVSKVTKATSKLVTTTVPNVTSAGSASTWNFAMGSGDAAETLIISGANSTAPTLGTAKTVATGSVSSSGTGSDVLSGLTISDKTVAKVASDATTVATGATSTTGTGDAVVTGVTIGSSAAAITALGTPTTANALTGVKVTSQPTIALASNSSSATGRVQVATGISSATATGTGVTVGTNDKVTVLKNTTDVSVTKGNA
jgi:hypothetical protein